MSLLKFGPSATSARLWQCWSIHSVQACVAGHPGHEAVAPPPDPATSVGLEAQAATATPRANGRTIERARLKRRMGFAPLEWVGGQRYQGANTTYTEGTSPWSLPHELGPNPHKDALAFARRIPRPGVQRGPSKAESAIDERVGAR